MTLIVGLFTADRRLFVGADSGSFTDEGNVHVVAGGKLFRKQNFVIGCAGSRRFAEVFQYDFEPPALTATDPAEVDAFMIRDFVQKLRETLTAKGGVSKEQTDSGDLIQGYSGSVIGVAGVGVYYLSPDFACTRPAPVEGEQLTATGGGSKYGLAAMLAASEREPRPRIELAMNVTARLYNCVRPPFNILEA